MDYKEKYQLWLDNVKDKQLLSELKSMKGNQIEEAFAGDLSFGTAGLRGIMAAGTNRLNIYTVYKTSEGLAQYMSANGMKKCAITYDSRINSQLFAQTAAATLARKGITVIITKECMPTPFLSFMVRELACNMGVNITASHNPSAYNGYKVYDSKGCQLLDESAKELTAYIDNVDLFAQELPNFADYANTLVSYCDPSLEEKYIKRVLDEGVGKIDGLSVVYTPLNGAGHRIVPEVLSRVGLSELHIVDKQSKPDGNFTTCPYPNPEKAEALSLALKLAKEKNADLVIANDPDCDRLGVAAKGANGFHNLSGNEIGILLTDFILNDLVSKNKVPNDPTIVKTIVTSPMTDAITQNYGARVRDVLTGFKYIGDVIAQLEQKGKRRNFVFGFEESCGYLKGTYVRDKDGVVAAMLIAQCASYYKQQGLTLFDRLEQLYEKHGYYYEKTVSYKFEGVSGETLKNELLTKLRRKPFAKLGDSNVVDTCDFLSQKEYDLPSSNVLRYRSEDGSQLIIRPSGTEPIVKCYISVRGDKAGNEARFEAIKEQTDEIFQIGYKKAKKTDKPRTFTTLKTVTCAMLCAVAVILASSFHALMETGLANLFAPMHFPILLIGILCGPIYGLIGGIVTPLISALTNASFTYTRAVPMMVELATYGLMTGLLRMAFLKNPKTNKVFATLVLIIAMVVGRCIHAVVKTVVVGGEDAFIALLWANFANDFTSTWAGIIVQLILIPAILYALLRGGILIKYIPDLPERLPAQDKSQKVKKEKKAKVEESVETVESQPEQETQPTETQPVEQEAPVDEQPAEPKNKKSKKTK